MIENLKKEHDILKPIFYTLGVFAFFILVSFMVNIYLDNIIEVIKLDGYNSALIYVLITVIATVFAPVTTLPLIPVASAIFGWKLAGFLYVTGLMVGSYVAFIISRKIGLPFVLKYLPNKQIYYIEKLIPEKNIFWALIALRMIMPVDILSYALGLFSKVGHFKYLVTTLIGITPFAFLFAYIGLIPVGLQAIVLFEIFILIFLSYYIYKGNYSLDKIKKIILAFIVLVLTITLFVFRADLLSFVGGLQDLGKNNIILVSIILILFKTVTTPLGFPGTPLTLLSGSILGPYWGTLIALVGNTSGAIIAFLFARYILREYVQEKIVSKYKKMNEFEKRIEKRAFPTVIALRLIPLFPFNALNFFLGITNIKIRQYAIGSFVGMIPGTFAFVYLGGSLTALSPINIGIAVFGIVLLILIGKFYEKRF